MSYASAVRERREVQKKKIKHNHAKCPFPFQFLNIFLLTPNLKISGFEIFFFF